ncbi:surface anchored protein [Streptococcus pneumoniae]|nr:surface anchored protein [Streptococcus pneumoniae]
MEKKSPMSRVERLHREKVTRYSIRKYSFGAASVAVAALFMFLGNGAVSANELSKQETSLAAPGLASEHEGPQEAESASVVAPALDAPSTPAESVPAAQPVVEEPAKPAAPEVTTPALDKKQLENYISEVKSKLSAGTYANKTEESLALLNGELASAESTLASATTQDELNVAYRNLVTTVSSKLKNKPKDSKDAPKVDTTNGQPTVGKKAENTEKKSESNAIENSGSHDSRNDKEISKDNPFRTEATDTEGPVAEIPYSEGRNVYVYGGESEGFDIKIKDNSGVVANATILRGGNQPFTSVSGEKDMLDVEFGYKANVFSTETTASESNPAVIHYTGLPGGTLNQKQLEEARTKGLNLGWRYVKATDKAGNDLRAIDERDNKPGALYVVVKPQTYKYNIQQPENNANKIAVSDINNLTETDIQKIKDQIKIGYSKTSQDARFESKKGQDLDNQASVVKSIEVNGQTITVTYKDGSVDTTPVADVARTDLDPVVEFPFSDAPKREIYVYGAEENSFDIKIKDDADKIKSATLLQWGSNPFKPVAGETDKVNTQYGYTANVISSETTASEAKPAVITYSGTPAPEGSFTQAKLEAATKGENPPGVALGWRYLKVVDSEGKEFVGSGKETANNMSLRVMLKPQTQKYDIQTPAEADKVAVDDASEVTEAEFNKIKEKLKIEYSKNNMDARLADKKGQAVENQADRIASIKKRW